MTFPVPSSSPPSFGRKKDAKQYAAKCCVEWLMASNYMPSDGENVVFAKGKARSSSQANTNDNGSTNGSAALNAQVNGDTVPQSSLNGNGTSNPPNTPRPKSPQLMNEPLDMYSDSTTPLTERVEALCRSLGLSIPRYRVTHSDGSKEFFDGYADFGVDSVSVPDGLGMVTNVWGGSRATKERIAEQVLFWLMKEEERRKDRFRVLCKMPEGGGVKVEGGDIEGEE